MGCTFSAKTVTDASPGLRWWLFSQFGASRLCPELLAQGLPLKLEATGPTVGRFFPSQCQAVPHDPSKVVQVTLSGTGYGYMEPAKRVGFSLDHVTVAYAPDFRLVGEDVYLWGRPVAPATGAPTLLHVGNPILGLQLPGLGSLTDVYAKMLFDTELAKGFTVVHNEDRGNDFALGILQPPERPRRPMRVNDEDRYTLANEVTVVQAEEQDFLGPFRVPEDRKLVLTLQAEGDAVEVMLLDRGPGELWRDAYQRGGLLPPPAAPRAAFPLQPGPRQETRFELPPGSYYVVLDHSSVAGVLRPTTGAGLQAWARPAAWVTYSAQLLDD